jgi:two-component system, OmpR family, sensor histidine kinase CpxA
VRSLFIRIFLWFWAATVLLVAVLLGTVYLTEPDVQTPHWRSLTRAFLNIYSKEAAFRYERLGCDGVQSYFQNQNPFPELGDTAVLTDASGHSLCGAPLSNSSEQFASQARSVSYSLFRRGDNSFLTATKTMGPSGKLYVLLIELPHFHPPPRIAIPARTWFLRILAVLITAGLVCYGLARHFAAPVRRLRAVAKRFASGDLKARVGKDPLFRRRDEIAELSRDFDDMAQRIEELVTRQDQLLQSQRRLLGDISHELRSPLTRLALASGLLQRKVSDDAKPLLSRIDRESERLNILIGQLLTLARLDVSPASETMESIHLNTLLEDVVNDAAFEAASKNVEIEFQARLDCTMNGVRDLLRSAFENVLRNAVRYTAAGTVVRLDLECAGKTVSVTVSDQGPGVPEQDLPHIFEAFYRVAEARDRQSGGTGLGLAITERTVRLHSGSVGALNRPKGGLSVCMTFPVGRTAKVNTTPLEAAPVTGTRAV